jgi:hypothetical protein
MQRRTKIAMAAASALAVAGAAGTGVAVATGDDDEAPITGTALDRASRAAVAHTGEGRVTGTEVGDEESTYEVEVTLDDGTQVDVQLDDEFAVVGDERDSHDDDGDDAD